MELLIFLFEVVGISLSGVMAPGAVTAAAIAGGSRSRFAGILIAVGHGIVEFPLMLLIILGMGKVFESARLQIGIGLAGGMMLILMAAGMLKGLRGDGNKKFQLGAGRPIVTGIVLSAGNPYFLLWWATVGLALATDAKQLGVWAFGLFAAVHWLCDCVWLGVLSWGSYKGLAILGAEKQRVILKVCAAALFGFGVLFIYKSAAGLVSA